MDNLQSAESDLAALERGITDYNTARKTIEANQRLTPDAKAADLQTLESNQVARLVELRDAVRNSIETEQQTLASEVQRMDSGAIIAPADLMQWQEAAARAGFAREDIEADPARAVVLFRDAMQRGDRVGAWLALRYGRPAAGDDLVTMAAWRAALAETIEPKRRKAIQDRMGQAEGLRRRLPITIGNAERGDFAGRYGVKAEYIPA